jgi:hypothetical protein
MTAVKGLGACVDTTKSGGWAMVKPNCLCVGLLWSMVFLVMSTALARPRNRSGPDIGRSHPSADRHADQLAPVDATTLRAMRDFLQANSSAPITEVHVWQLPEERYIVEVRANLGARWGGRVLAKKLAVALASACFASPWPLAEARITVDTNRSPLLTLNLGRNQAEKLFSHQGKGVDALFRDIKHMPNIHGPPADRLWVVEWFRTRPQRP